VSGWGCFGEGGAAGGRGGAFAEIKLGSMPLNPLAVFASYVLLLVATLQVLPVL
jgi:hypothetical protein